MTLAEMCKEVRQILGISQKTLARYIGSNQTEVSFIERGFIPENPHKIYAIHKIYEAISNPEKQIEK